MFRPIKSNPLIRHVTSRSTKVFVKTLRVCKFKKKNSKSILVIYTLLLLKY